MPIIKQASEHKLYQQKRMANPLTRDAEILHRSTAWKKLRALVLAKNPVCDDPYGVHRKDKRCVMAELVHHIVPLTVNRDLALCMDNLQPLCRVCHREIHKRMKESEGVGGIRS